LAFRIDRMSASEAQAIAGANGSKLKGRLDKAFSKIEEHVTALEQALAVGQEYMADIPAVNVSADYTGAVSPSSQLPKIIACRRYNGTTDESASSTWSATARNGGVTCSIGAATGNLTISGITASDIVDVTSVRSVNGVTITLTKALNVNLSSVAAPIAADSGGSASGSGGTTGTQSSFSSFNTTTAATVCTVTAKAGSAGQIQLSAPLNITTAAAGPQGSIQSHLQWHDGSGFLGTEATSSPNCSVVAEGLDYTVYDGAITSSFTKTGLTPGTSYSFDLKARNQTSTRTMYLYGTASAVGS
jgi:hypothetical protein